jgi:hypothetical protein
MELELELDKVSAYDDIFHACHDLILSSKANQFRTKFSFTCHPASNPRIIFKFLYNFPMMIMVPILLQVLN